jgi:hypothetical protein
LPDVDYKVKGDWVEIVVDAGGSTLSYQVEATRAGRRVDVTHGRGVVEVTELTRGGTPVRTARFMASRVLALVEHPAPRPVQPDDTRPAPPPIQLDGTRASRPGAVSEPGST